ncbi:unnamed protein product [Penicillium olsonii]|uniref:Uncharacterized protein n=1 Tax=Penicillium olsonii TaxID=99116 RepID=A0A9W4IAE8_PENOL|nr:unnamed protein product [Penicillium olsonii]CAG8162306.1 unnamed protein product [Penicillium olsonii]CAG8245817.1 unnamed protein product [Penicillium olsonii]
MSRQLLQEPVQDLLDALTKSEGPDILSTFTTSPKPLAHEHGLPQLAPFLGRSFHGQEGISAYFDLLSTYLQIENMKFEPEETWVIDESCMAIALRGTATFTWKETQHSWEETFAYRIKVAEDVSDDSEKNGSLKVCEYQIWADTGAAYLASLGNLDDMPE